MLKTHKNQTGIVKHHYEFQKGILCQDKVMDLLIIDQKGFSCTNQLQIFLKSIGIYLLFFSLAQSWRCCFLFIQNYILRGNSADCAKKKIKLQNIFYVGVFLLRFRCLYLS